MESIALLYPPLLCTGMKCCDRIPPILTAFSQLNVLHTEHYIQFNHAPNCITNPRLKDTILSHNSNTWPLSLSSTTGFDDREAGNLYQQ